MFTIVFYIVSLATLISFFYYKKFNKTVYTYFFMYLLFTFLVELFYNIMLFNYIKYDTPFFISGYFTYNVHIIITYLFYFIFYKRLFRTKKNKKIMLFFLFLFCVFALVNYFGLKQIFSGELNTHNIVVGSILLLITLILFLIEIINDEKIIFNIHKSFIFWISVGLLLFYIGIIPIMISNTFLKYNATYINILYVLNLLMYGSFIIGMVKSDTKYNY